MNLDISSVIFISFLIATLILGLASSRGVSSIKEYAIGNRNFSTATIVATIVATWISGDFFYSSITEAYNNGLYSIWIATGDPICLFVIGILFAPRMKEFLGKLSIAEAMGALFGKKVRIITAVAGFIGAAGFISVQLKLSGLIFQYALNVPSLHGIILSASIVILYSSLGGIRSVTFTDVIQFFTFGVVIPLIAYSLLTSVDNIKVVKNTLTTNPLFDYMAVFDFSNPLSFNKLFLFLALIIPGFSPAIFQRVAMAKDTAQIKKSFIIAGIVCLLLGAILNWIAVLTLSINPFLESHEIIKHIIFNFSSGALKGAALAGIMAMIMSTVDSDINSTSVLIVHDFLEPLNLKFSINELLTTRIAALLLGLLSLFLSLREGTLLELLLTTSSFYMPIVTVPFIMAVFGFRSTEKSVMLGMGMGFITVLFWRILQINATNAIPPAMFANLIVLITSHYFLKQPGGWVGIQDNSDLINARKIRKIKLKRFLVNIRNSNIIEICKDNSPKGDGLISILGFFVMISVFASTHTLAKEYQIQYTQIIDILYPMALCSSSILIAYPLWIDAWRRIDLIYVFWNMITFSVLICFSFLMVLISNFAEIQLMVFMVNIIIISSFNKWQWSLFNILFGVTLVTVFCKYNYPLAFNEFGLLSSQFKIVYLLLLISSSLIFFLKPKQEYIEATEHKVDNLETKVEHLNGEITDLGEKVTHYSQRTADQALEIERLGATSQKILNNVNHELRLPVGNVMNFAGMLSEGLERYNKEQLKELSDEVFKNSNRLSTMILNMLDLAMLDVKKIELDRKTVNLSELVEDRVNSCRKIYLQGKEIDFDLRIEPNILVSVDPNYIRQTVDNLIINAITYSKNGTIKISVLKNSKNRVELIVQDEGIGIPKSELFDIFDPFKMGKHTQSKAEGRGVGLALCKSAVEAHGGAINVASEDMNGAIFKVLLPI